MRSGPGPGRCAAGSDEAGRGLGLHVAVGIALVLGLGVAGAASAEALIGSKQVKDGSLTGADLRRGTVRSSDVRDGSLRARDFEVVPQGPPGLQGPTGVPGISGSPGVVIVDLPHPAVAVPGNSAVAYSVPCGSSRKAVFGGSSLSTSLRMVQSAPEIDGSAWDFVVRNLIATDQEPTRLYAVCVVVR